MLCQTPIAVTLYADELDEDGSPAVLAEFERKCNYQDSTERRYTSQKQYIQLSGKAYFCGDIAPDAPIIAGGKAVIFGEERQIIKGTKARNPDGSVNYTCLELM